MSKRVDPTPFDLGVIKVVEYLASVMHNLRHDLPQFENKGDLIKAIGLTQWKWHEMVNNLRHVSTKADKQTAIVAKLHSLFRVDPNYIYHYPQWPRMFVEEILVHNKPVNELVGKSAHELRSIIMVQHDEIKQLQTELKAAKEDVELWKGLAKMQQQSMTVLGLAADDGASAPPPEPPKKPAKKPAKPTPYKKRKPRQ